MLALAAVVLAFGPAAPVASAIPSTQAIHSPGPLTDIWIGTDLSCQVARKGADAFAFFPPRQPLADCGTFLSVGGTVFGPEFDGHTSTSFPGGDNYVPFTATSQSAVDGAGTAADPYRIVTSVSAADTGLMVTEVDSYVTGEDRYRTDIVVSNSGPVAVTALLFHGADCYLQSSDIGFGAITIRGAPACTSTPNNSPSGELQELAPLSPGHRYVEGQFEAVWNHILGQTDLPNTCQCEVDHDNGAAVSWSVSIPAGGSVTQSLLSNFSEAGQVVGSPAVVTGPATLSREHATVSGSVNPEGAEVTDCRFSWGPSTSYGRSVPCAESVGAGTSPVPVSARLPDLDRGKTYHYRLQATTGGGTTTGADQTLEIPSVPQLGKTANLVPISGQVLIRTPRGSRGDRRAGHLSAVTKGKGFVPLTRVRQIPMGTQIDARRGTLDLIAARAKPGRTGSARLAGGVFSVSQIGKGRRKGLTTFTLRSGLFKGAPSFASCRRSKGGKSSGAYASRLSRKALQTLRARDRKGKFRTKGRHSAGTVRGTAWNTTERCDGTLTTVKRGVVDVRNFKLRKTVPVRAGYHYLSAADPSEQRRPQRNR